MSSATTATTGPTGPVRTQKRSKVRLKVFAVLWVIILLNYIDRAALSISLPFIAEDFHISTEVKGLIMSSFFWTYLIFQVPGGWLLDKFGPRRVVTWAGAIWGTFQALGGAVTNGLLLGVTRVGLGAAEAPCAPAGGKLNGNWLPAKERARGATFIDMAGPFGSAVGGLIVTGIIGWLGSWRWAFVFTGVLTLAVALIYRAYVKDTPEEHKGVNEAELAYIREGQSATNEIVDDSVLPTALDYARSPSFWGMMFGRLGWAVAWWGIISWTPSYLADEMGFDLAKLGWGTFMIYMFGVVGQLIAGNLADWARAKTGSYNLVMKLLFGISGIGAVVSILSLLWIENGYAALFALALAVFFIMFGGLYWAIPAWLAPKKQVGTVGGVMNISSSGGGLLAPAVMGFVIANAGGSYGSSFAFLAAAAGVYFLGSMVIDFAKPLATVRTT